MDKYSWVDIGSSFLPSDILAGLLWAQMEISHKIQARRKTLSQAYLNGLTSWAKEARVQLPFWPAHCTPSHHLFALLMPSAADQTGLITHLKHHGINAVFHYLPLHLSERGRALGGRPGDCPVTESVALRLVRLPLYFDLSDAEQERILTAVQTYRPVAANH